MINKLNVLKSNNEFDPVFMDIFNTELFKQFEDGNGSEMWKATRALNLALIEFKRFKNPPAKENIK